VWNLSSPVLAGHMEDERSGIVRDVMKHMNIITYGDWTRVLATMQSNTAASNQFVGRVTISTL